MKKNYQVICLLIMAFLFFMPVQTFAVAGGHGGGSTGGGSIGEVPIPIIGGVGRLIVTVRQKIFSLLAYH